MKLSGLFGSALLALLCIAALLAPWISSHDPSAMSLQDQFASPSLEHFFGRDQNGADVFSQTVFGARISLSVAFAVVTVSASLGMLMGSLAGYSGGWIDQLTMRLIDLVQAFPGFLLALALVAVLGPSIPHLIFAMCLTGWTSYARLVRGEVLHLKTRDYVHGAIAAGASSRRILVRHIWPNLAGLLIVQATFGMAGVILAESGLSFLGLGAPPETPTWGALLNSGRSFLSQAPHISFFPGLAILLLVLSMNLIGEALRAKFDPRHD